MKYLLDLSAKLLNLHCFAVADLVGDVDVVLPCRRKLPEGQLAHSAVAYSPTSNNLQLTESAAPTDSTSSSLLQQLSSLASNAGSSSHQAPADAFPPRQPHSAEQRSSSLSSVTTEVPQSQIAEATRSSQAASALQAPGATPAAAAHPRLTPAQPRVIQLGPIFQPMLAAMQTDPSVLARAIAHSSRQSQHPDRASAAQHTKAHQAMQQLLTAAEAIGYCQGIRQRASEADKLQKLMFHREGVDPLSGSDLAVRPPRASQPDQQQPDEVSSAHHQAVAAADSQTAPQHQLSTTQHAAPQPLSALSESSSGPSMPVSSQQAHSHQPQEAPCKTGLLSSDGPRPSVCGSKHAHETSDAHMQVSSSKRRRLVEVAQLRDPPPHRSAGGSVIKFRCNIADILDVHCGPFNGKSTSAEFGPARSSSIRPGPSRAPTMPLASLPGAAAITSLPAMPASSTVRSTASISATPSLPPPSQGLSRRAKTAPQQPTAGSVAGAVAAAQGTDWALAAHAAALSSSWRSCLPNLLPQQGTVSQASQAHLSGAQTGVLLQPNYMLASFPHIVNQLMMQPRSDLMPTWVAGHQPPAHQPGGNDAGMRSGQEEPPPSKRLCQGQSAILACCIAHLKPDR